MFKFIISKTAASHKITRICAQTESSSSEYHFSYSLNFSFSLHISVIIDCNNLLNPRKSVLIRGYITNLLYLNE